MISDILDNPEIKCSKVRHIEGREKEVEDIPIVSVYRLHIVVFVVYQNPLQDSHSSLLSMHIMQLFLITNIQEQVLRVKIVTEGRCCAF
jgi:hypothetical protein